MVKTLKKKTKKNTFFVRNQEADNFETWYTSLCTQVQPN